GRAAEFDGAAVLCHALRSFNGSEVVRFIAKLAPSAITEKVAFSAPLSRPLPLEFAAECPVERDRPAAAGGDEQKGYRPEAGKLDPAIVDIEAVRQMEVERRRTCRDGRR